MRPPNSKSMKIVSKSPESPSINTESLKKATKLDTLTQTKKPLSSVSKNKHGTSVKITSQITESSLTLLLTMEKTANLKKYKPKPPKRNNFQNHQLKNHPAVCFPSLK